MGVLRREAARVDVLRLRGRRRDAVHAQLVLVRDVLHLDDALADVHGGEVLEAMPQRSVSRVQRPRIALRFRELRLELLRVPSVVRDLLGRRLVQVDRERLRGFGFFSLDARAVLPLPLAAGASSLLSLPPKGRET